MNQFNFLRKKTLCDTDSFLGCRATRKCRHCNGTGIVMDDNERIFLTTSSKCECQCEYFEDCSCPVKCECEGSGECIECQYIIEDQKQYQDQDQDQNQNQDQDQNQNQDQDLVQEILLKIYIFILFNLYFY